MIGSSWSSTKPAFVPTEEPSSGTFTAPGAWPAACASAGRTSSSWPCGASSSSSGGCAPRNGPRFSATTRSTVGGRGAEIAAECATNSCRSPIASAWLRQPLRADRRDLVAAQPGAAERAAGVAGIDLDVVRQLGEPPQRGEQVLGALARVDGEVGPRRVADQQRVAGQQVALDEEAAVLGPVAGRVQHLDRERADDQLVAVRERLARVLGLGQRVDRDRHAVLEREAAVPGDVVGVVVRLEHAHDPHARLLGRLEVRLDRVGGVDDHRLAGRLVTDQVGRAAEIVVDELLEDHFATTVPTAAACFLEVSACLSAPSKEAPCPRRASRSS